MKPLTSEDINAFAEELRRPREPQPNMIWITSYWSDEQIKSVLKAGCYVTCDMFTWKRIHKLREEGYRT